MPDKPEPTVRKKYGTYILPSAAAHVVARVKVGQGEPLHGSDVEVEGTPVPGQIVGAEEWFALGSAAEVDDKILQLTTVIPDAKKGDKLTVTHEVHGAAEPLVIQHFYDVGAGQSGDQILMTFVDLDVEKGE